MDKKLTEVNEKVDRLEAKEDLANFKINGYNANILKKFIFTKVLIEDPIQDEQKFLTGLMKELKVTRESLRRSSMTFRSKKEAGVFESQYERDVSKFFNHIREASRFGNSSVRDKIMRKYRKLISEFVNQFRRSFISGWEIASEETFPIAERNGKCSKEVKSESQVAWENSDVVERASKAFSKEPLTVFSNEGVSLFLEILWETFKIKCTAEAGQSDDRDEEWRDKLFNSVPLLTCCYCYVSKYLERGPHHCSMGIQNGELMKMIKESQKIIEKDLEKLRRC